VYVGTDCGISLSRDAGVGWLHVRLEPDSAAGELRDVVFDVLALNYTAVVAAGRRGTFFSVDRGRTWTRSTWSGGINQGIRSPSHAFARSPASDQHVFYTDSLRSIAVSTDGGASWQPLDVPDPGTRPSFVRTGSLQGSVYSVYFGSGVRLHRRPFQHAPTGPRAVGGWEVVTLPHNDPTDIAFDGNGAPRLAGSDGGLSKSADGGVSWHMVGAGSGGYNALQLYDVVGQRVLPRVIGRPGDERRIPGRYELFVGTQDNSVWGSRTAGRSWPNSLGAEGYELGVARVQTDPEADWVTGRKCANPCSTFLGREALAREETFPDAPRAVGTPVPFPKRPGHYLQQITGATGMTSAYALTTNYGATWTTVFEIDLAPADLPRIAGPADSPILYLPVRRAGTTAGGIGRVGLLRIEGVYDPGGATVTDADVTGLGSIGLAPYMFDWAEVVAVHPDDPDFLIAADVDPGEARYTKDGGRTWWPLPSLTRAVTGDGAKTFVRDGFPIMSHIAFDDYSGCHVLAGTRDNGIVESNDGGATWRRVRGSSFVWNTSSFHFTPTSTGNGARTPDTLSGSIFVSSFGRGLWRLRTDRSSTCAPLPTGGFEGLIVTDAETRAVRRVAVAGDLELCETCELLAVLGGEMAGVDLDGRRLTGMALTGGVLRRYSSKLEERPATLPVEYRPPAGALAAGFPGPTDRRHPTQPPEVAFAVADSALPALDEPIRAVIVEGDLLRATVRSRRPLRLPSERLPHLIVTSAAAWTAQPALSNGERFVVLGHGFVPPVEGGSMLTVYMDGGVIERNLSVSGAGTFVLESRAPRALGPHPLIFEQRVGQRTDRQWTILRVLPDDEPDPQPDGRSR
jgi:hypothetical protein